jgi:hypothetical protein
MATKDVTTQAGTFLQVTEDMAEFPCAAKNEGLQPMARAVQTAIDASLSTLAKFPAPSIVQATQSFGLTVYSNLLPAHRLN